MRQDGTITVTRHDEDGEVVRTIACGYRYRPGHPGSRYGDYPEPPEPASADVWPLDAGVRLSEDEEHEAERAAVADHDGRYAEAMALRDARERELER